MENIDDQFRELWDWSESKGTIKKDQRPTIRKPEGKSPVVVSEVTKQNETCICKETKLYWGRFFTCQERKKIIEISSRLACKPDYLTSAMALETGGKFDPAIVNPLGYTGLIQIGSTAAEDINRRKGTDITAGDNGNLINMSKLEQLTYVEYYLEPYKGKLNTLADFYLAILMPIDCGKGANRNHVVFDKNIILDYNSKGDAIRNTKWVRQRGYAANPVFHKESHEQGKTYVWEIAEEIEAWYERGKNNKVTDFSCENIEKQNPIEDIEWHDPVDNPQLCLYTQNGNYRPRYNVFGNVRKERANSKHQGIDFLAIPGSNVYACIESTVEFISVQTGYGNVICLKVKDPQTFKKRKKDITLEYADEGEIKEGTGFNYNGDFYLFYAHLQSVSSDIKKGDTVKCGKIIGKNGTSGYGSTKDPHLHFEIRNNAYASGLNNRCHPGIFINYKGERDMTKAERDYHKEVAQKIWD